MTLKAGRIVHIFLIASALFLLLKLRCCFARSCSLVLELAVVNLELCNIIETCIEQATTHVLVIDNGQILLILMVFENETIVEAIYCLLILCKSLL